jgi:hypothetical protein
MMYSRKKTVEELPTELTVVWSCSSEQCKGWMRDNFSLSEAPVCFLCQSPMIKEERMLATVENTSYSQRK